MQGLNSFMGYLTPDIQKAKAPTRGGQSSDEELGSMVVRLETRGPMFLLYIDI